MLSGVLSEPPWVLSVHPTRGPKVDCVIDVVGIGADGWSSLGEAERHLIAAAEDLFGSPRQLDLLPPGTARKAKPWPSPLRPALPQLLAGHDQIRTVVLASGDPLLSGIGSTLVDIFGIANVRVHPGVSSVALARARMGWAAHEVEVTRLNDPAADAIRRYLSPFRQLVVLSRDRNSPAAVCEVLRDAGFGPSPVTVLSNLGTSSESRFESRAESWPDGDVPDLNTICVRCVPEQLSPLWTSSPGLADDVFDHDGQLTKRNVRASALAHLMPVAGQLLWDVGAGAGSVGIEWMRVHPTCRAFAIERDPARARSIAHNASRLGVPELTVVEGSAPEALRDLPQPDAVFIGGGGTPETVDCAWGALNGGGRLVMHAVTLETEMLLHSHWQRLGGQLTRISIELMQPLGGYSGWKPARAVVAWSIQKSLAPAVGP